MRTINTYLASLLCCLIIPQVARGVPQLIGYQGRVTVDGSLFEGTGQFRFALVNGDGSATWWSNDGTSVAGSEPATAVSLPVSSGLYSVLLGDAGVGGMDILSASVFARDDVYLRVWFDDEVNGSVQLAPDQRIAAVGFALMAARVEEVRLDEIVAPPSDPVVAWGRNEDGQTAVPTGLVDIADVAAGDAHTLLVTAEGDVLAFGSDSTGQITVPESLGAVSMVAAGGSHSLAVLADGGVVAWGSDGFGQSTVPGGLSNVTQVAGGQNHSVVLQQSGTIQVWGDDSFGQLSVPVAAASAVAIVSGDDHILALLPDRTVVAWGRNDTGQADVPGDLSEVRAIAAGAFHSLALKFDGTVVAWGWNSAGQSDVPDGLAEVVAIAAGYTYSAALTETGDVVVWGDDSYGQRNAPESARNLVALTGGRDHLVVLRAAFVPAALARLDEPNRFSGPVGIGRDAATNALEVEGQASKSTAGNWLANSDGRIKADIRPLTDALGTLDRVRLVDFRYSAEYRAGHPGVDDVRYLNVVAQEFAEVFPEHVHPSGESLADGSPILQVDTYPLTIYSAAAIQELHRETKFLREENRDLRKRLERLENISEDHSNRGDGIPGP